MSEYSDSLKKYIEEKNIKIVQMIQYCGLERSTMYKIINGKRKPASLENAKKIAHYMQLSPKECEDYYRAYYRTVLGEELYEQNYRIQELIHDFKQVSQPPVYMKRSEGVIEAVDEEPVHMLNEKAELDYHIRILLEKEMQKEHPVVRLMTQCENEYLLQTLLELGKHREDLEIRQIICFQKQVEYSQKNFDVIQKILRFYTCECHYEPYYYYDDIFSHFYNMNLFCNYIICESGILGYTSDYAYGQLIRDERYRDVYIQLFEEYRSKTYPLLTRVYSMIDEYLALGQEVLEGAAQAKAYSLQSEPCVIPFVTNRILNRNIEEHLPEREHVMRMFGDYITELRSSFEKGNFISFFTLDGLENFLRTGKIDEIPEELYHPLEQRDRIEIAQRMVSYAEAGKHRILKNRLARITSDLHIFVSPSRGYFLFSNRQRELVYIKMNEPGMIRQFCRFMEGLNEELSLYTPEEAVDEMKRLIEKYSKSTGK